MKFRKIHQNDLIEVVKIHLNAFSKDHFTSNFSADLLHSFYYMQIQENEFCFVAEENNMISGFIVAGYNTNKAVKEFTKKFKLHLLLKMLQNPIFILKKIKSLLNRDHFISTAGLRLLSIATIQNQQSKGVGKLMITEFEKQLKEAGEKLYGLSVNKTNLKAIGFYKKTDFKIEHETPQAIYYLKHL
jgi:ribosomal protein S18 acetylase RimI-like enzyme